MEHESEIAQAILKLAEVHDRRLGEIAAGLNRVADQLSIPEDASKPETGMGKLCRDITNHGYELRDAIQGLRLPE